MAALSEAWRWALQQLGDAADRLPPDPYVGGAVAELPVAVVGQPSPEQWVAAWWAMAARGVHLEVCSGTSATGGGCWHALLTRQPALDEVIGQRAAVLTAELAAVVAAEEFAAEAATYEALTETWRDLADAIERAGGYDYGA